MSWRKILMSNFEIWILWNQNFAEMQNQVRPWSNVVFNSSLVRLSEDHKVRPFLIEFVHLGTFHSWILQCGLQQFCVRTHLWVFSSANLLSNQSGAVSCLLFFSNVESYFTKQIESFFHHISRVFSWDWDNLLPSLFITLLHHGYPLYCWRVITSKCPNFASGTHCGTRRNFSYR